jgi:hypothetical protein
MRKFFQKYEKLTGSSLISIVEVRCIIYEKSCRRVNRSRCNECIWEAGEVGQLDAVSDADSGTDRAGKGRGPLHRRAIGSA